MRDIIDITILASQDCDPALVHELLEVHKYLSSRVSNQVRIDCQNMEIPTTNHGLAIAVDGYMIHETTLTGLVDFLHFHFLRSQAA